MATLTGRFEHALDVKGRLFAPSRFREQLTQEGGPRFMVARGLDKCLYLFLPSQWEAFRAEVEAATYATPQQRRSARRFFFSNAAEAQPDEQGRILIPESLREHAGLEKELVVLGVGSRAEIWDKATLAKAEKGSEKEFAKLSETLDL